MFYALISFLGLIVGLILSKEFKTELKDIKTFIKIISFLVLSFIMLRLILLSKFDFIFLLGLITGFTSNYFIKNNYFYYGFILMLTEFMQNNDKIFFSILIFMLGLNYSVLKNINKKFLILSLILFALPFTLLLTNLTSNYNNFIFGFTVGGLLYGFKQYYK